MKKLVLIRRCSQVSFLGFFIFVLWSTTYPLKSVFSPRLLFLADPLIMLMTAVSERAWLAGLSFAFLMITLTLVLGRFFCGWVCPLGTMLDAAAALRGKKRAGEGQWNKKWRSLKFLILFVIILAALAGAQIAWVMDPIVIMGRVISLNVIPAVTLALDRAFIFLIKTFGWYDGPMYDFYSDLKGSLLGVHVYFFANSLATFVFFLAVCGAAAVVSRFWCRALCPLGGLYAILARFSLLKRRVLKCRDCRICSRLCRMGAIYSDASYEPGECILCMDCVYQCPERSTIFTFKKARTPVSDSQGMTKRQFLLFLLAGFSFAGCSRALTVFKKRTVNVIRPPGAAGEEQFVNRCVRCGNCMKVCITNGLQPVMMKSGLQGIWTPELVPEIGYCEYQCTLCGQVCPTGAIPLLAPEIKMKTSLGVAVIDKSLCLAWARNEQCLVCEEHCPVPQKAIKIQEDFVNGRRIPKPVVDRSLCIGCGICQNKCPVRPVRAITVQAFNASKESLIPK